METVCRNEISPSAKIIFFLNRLSSFSNLLLVWHALIYFQLLGFLIAEEPILKYSQLSYTEFTLHHLGMFCIILIFLLSALCQVRVNLIFIVFFYIYFLVLTTLRKARSRFQTCMRDASHYWSPSNTKPGLYCISYLTVPLSSIVCKDSLIDPNGASFLFCSWWSHRFLFSLFFPLFHSLTQWRE